MKYLLIIGIEFKFFQEPADITIHIANQFVDTFKLDRDYPCATDVVSGVESKWYERHGRADWLSRADWAEMWTQLPSLFKVYEIDESVVQGKLKIKVENSNSNYNNGFMNKSSMIKFSVVSIVQKDLTRNRGEKWMEKIIKLDVAADGTYPDHKNLGIKPSDRMAHLRKHSWLCAEVCYVQRDNEIYQKSGPCGNHFFLGGSFTAEYTIRKKEDTVYVGLPAEKEWIENPRPIHTVDLIVASSNELLNIYDEDQ